jgi:protocatechuate 3,4-dioxygenase beta subunit
MRTFQRWFGRVSAAVLTGMILTQAAMAQVNSTISGTVEDSRNALIPGVTISATNTQTSVETRTLTNEAGAYNFPALIPGTYRLKAELTGFNTKTVSNIELGPACRFDKISFWILRPRELQ